MAAEKLYVVKLNYQIPYEPTSDTENIGVCNSLDAVETTIREYMARNELYSNTKISNYVIEEFVVNRGQSCHCLWLYGEQMKKFVQGASIEETLN